MSLRKRPKILTGKTIEMRVGCGKLHVIVNVDENNLPFEVFASIGKGGGCAASQCEAIGRLISLNLRTGGDVKRIIKQLKGISCHNKMGLGENQLSSCADAIGKAIEEVLGLKPVIKLPKKEKVIVPEEVKSEAVVEPEPTKVHNGACPECGGTLVYQEGCDVCNSCGYSHCS
jgi:ribonucleoside-diphosphate reductase alpha chain